MGSAWSQTRARPCFGCILHTGAEADISSRMPDIRRGGLASRQQWVAYISHSHHAAPAPKVQLLHCSQTSMFSVNQASVIIKSLEGSHLGTLHSVEVPVTV